MWKLLLNGKIQTILSGLTIQGKQLWIYVIINDKIRSFPADNSFYLDLLGVSIDILNAIKKKWIIVTAGIIINIPLRYGKSMSKIVHLRA